MKILIVSATAMEIGPLLGVFEARTGCAFGYHGHDIDLVVSGVGMVAAAAWTSRELARSRYDFALNLGICGSFDSALATGSVVHVISDGMPELGAEDGNEFLTLQVIGQLASDEPPFSRGRLFNRAPPQNPVLAGLPAVNGISVNTVHGNEQSIAKVIREFAPQVESMEGAGFMYACMLHEATFAQVRAVSNVVEKRNRAAWKTTDAIANLCGVALEILDHA
jgi:futalosine hydrolase